MDRDKKNKPFPYLATLVAFVAIVIMLALGFWQLERKAEKEARLAQMDFASTQQTLALDEILASPENYQDFTVTFNGMLRTGAFYIDNKLRQGRAGYHVLIPLNTDYGVLMLNLGWIEGTGNRAALPTFETHFSQEQLTSAKGIVYLPLNNTIIRETNTAYGQFPALLQQVDLAEISEHLGVQVLPFVARLLPQDTSAFSREWDRVTMLPEKHLAYAIQWFGLAIAAVTIYLLSLQRLFNRPIASINDAGKDKDAR